MANLFGNYMNTVLSLQTLLRVKFISGRNTNKFYIGKCVQRAFDCQSQGQMEEFSWHLAPLICLNADLVEIAKSRPELLGKFRKHLRSSYVSDYAGARLEVYAAAKLIRSGINFKKTEAPDFRIMGYRSPVHLECASTHFSEPPTVGRGNLIYKIESCINKKINKKYRKENLILFLDATNIFHYSVPVRSNVFKENFRLRILKCLHHSNFSSILVFSFLINVPQQRFGYVWNRFDKTPMSIACQKFCRGAFPANKEKVYNYQLPRFS